MKRQRGNRAAFTLLEMLMVISIIVVLAALLLSASNRVMTKLPEVQTRTEISQLDAGIATFMLDYGLTSPPPSFLFVREDGLYNPSPNTQDSITVQFLQKWFGRTFNWKTPTDWNGNGIIDLPYYLHGQQCLVFWNGGIPSRDATTGLLTMIGFNANSNSPALAVAGKLRHGPYFNFQSTRLSLPLSNPVFPVYNDPWGGKTGSQPYAYFSTQGNLGSYNVQSLSLGLDGDCYDIGAHAYQSGLSIGGNVTYINPTGYQILSAGRDCIFTADTVPIVPGSAYWQPVGGGFSLHAKLNPQGQQAGRDDQSNFSSTLLGIGQH